MKKYMKYLVAALAAILLTPLAYSATLTVSEIGGARSHNFVAGSCADNDSIYVTPPAYSSLVLIATVGSNTGFHQASVSGPAGSVSASAGAGGSDSKSKNVNVPGSGGSYKLAVSKTSCGGYSVAQLISIY